MDRGAWWATVCGIAKSRTWDPPCGLLGTTSSGRSLRGEQDHTEVRRTKPRVDAEPGPASARPFEGGVHGGVETSAQPAPALSHRETLTGWVLSQR